MDYMTVKPAKPTEVNQWVQMTQQHPLVAFAVCDDGTLMITTERGAYRLEAGRLLEIGFIPHA